MKVWNPELPPRGAQTSGGACFKHRLTHHPHVRLILQPSIVKVSLFIQLWNPCSLKRVRGRRYQSHNGLVRFLCERTESMRGEEGDGGREKNGGMREGEKDYCWRRESEKWSKVDGKKG